ncbi:MAG TPA: DUF1697 domain-containing protein [Vicinamibacterales bacterium]|nr:DUF1697 domain-containing protein [Vicinamibacterales bacterium]
MTTYVGLLRAVNLPAHNKVGMAELRHLLIELGMDDVRTLLQSGNVVFGSEVRTASEVERLLEASAAKRLGLDIDFFVRTPAEWKGIMAGNPFPHEAKADPSHLLVIDKKLGTRGTGRNWNTVLKLGALAGAS